MPHASIQSALQDLGCVLPIIENVVRVAAMAVLVGWFSYLLHRP